MTDFDKAPTRLISIHALREEGDTLLSVFQPVAGIISIHALREEGDSSTSKTSSMLMISIHALREEGDLILLCQLNQDSDFYPRPPRGGRPWGSSHSTCAYGFLSTPSARRATQFQHSGGGRIRDFYPRPPRGGRL